MLSVNAIALAWCLVLESLHQIIICLLPYVFLQIGSNQPSPSFPFQNLIKLNVKNCGSLRYLLSFSMAACFGNLSGLYVSGCEMMEDIIAQEINTEKEKVCELYSFTKFDYILILVLFIVLKDIFMKKSHLLIY